jgi:hypothetical protein
MKGTGFSPYVDRRESLGPEGIVSSTPRPKSCPQGLKPVVLASIMYGLKPVPFEPEVFSRNLKAVPLQKDEFFCSL